MIAKASANADSLGIGSQDNTTTGGEPGRLAMGQARCNARKRRQAANGFAHMSGDMRRPKYRRKALAGIGAAIARERERAAAEAKRKQGRK